MAVTWRCVTEGLRTAPGSKRLMAARWLLIVLSSVPALLAARAALAAGPGRSTYFTMTEAPLPAVHVGELFAELPAAFAAAMAATALAMVAEQFLLAGAVTLLGDPPRPERPRVLATLRSAGSIHLRRFLGLVLIGLVIGGAGAMVLRGLMRFVRHHGQVAGWGGVTMGLVLPATSALLALLWAAAVGAWLLWARVLMVRGDAGVGRAARAAFRAMRIHPLVALIFPMALTLVCLALGGAILAAWLAAEPSRDRGVAGWTALMLAWMGVQSAAWHWMVRSACLAAAADAPADAPAVAPAVAAGSGPSDRADSSMQPLSRAGAPPEPGASAPPDDRLPAGRTPPSDDSSPHGS